jgi:alkylresorcinol/alkylpyrone synthase
MRDVPDQLTRPRHGDKPTLDVGLLSLVTAAPPNVVSQEEVMAGTKRAFADRVRDFDRVVKMFAATGIQERRLTQPFDWYFDKQGWPERSAAYLQGADALFIEAAAGALDAARIGAEEVDTIVTVSSTGIATPSLEARAMKELGFRRDVRRVPVFGLGCAGGVAGLALGAELAAARPGSVVLVVTIELCSLSVRLDEVTKANMVAMALFGDGAAAAVLAAGAGGAARILDTGHHTWPDTLGVMGWRVDPVGFGVIFDKSIPGFAHDNLRGAVDGILASQKLGRADIDRFICHPGGRKVIEAIEGAMDIDAGSLDHERDVLRHYANMSAPTALFVLERALSAGLPKRSMLMALGPGFSISTATLGQAA